MPLQNAHVIDLIAQDPATNVVVLGMTESRPWDGSDRRVFELQEKVNAYLSFALDGEMAEQFPQFMDKTVRLQLECAAPPDGKTAYFIDIIREQISFQGIEFTVKVTPELATLAETECCGGGGCCGGEKEGKTNGHSHPHGEETGCCGGGGGGGCGCG